MKNNHNKLLETIERLDVTSSLSGANIAIDSAIGTFKGMRSTLGSGQLRFLFA